MKLPDKHIGIILTILAISLSFERLISMNPPIGPDAFLYEYGGWILSTGGQPYVTFFDVKPPGGFYFTSLLATISGNDINTFHRLAIISSVLFLVVGVMMLVRIVWVVTESKPACFSAGIMILTFPVFYGLPATGFRPKTIIIAVTFTSIYLWNIDKHRLSFIVSMFAPAFWQLAVFIPLTIGAFHLKNRPYDIRILTPIGIVITLMIIIPTIFISGIRVLFLATVIAPLDTGGTLNPIRNILYGGFLLRFAIPIALIGGIQNIKELITDGAHPVSVLFIVYVFVTVFIDLSGPPDLLLVYGFAAIGFGKWFYHLNTDEYQVCLLICMILSVGNFINFLSFPELPYTPPIAGPNGQEPHQMIDVSLLWDMQYPDTCFVRNSIGESWAHSAGYDSCKEFKSSHIIIPISIYILMITTIL